MYFMQKGITIFRWKNFVSQFEKFRRGNRLCLTKFRVSKNFMPKRGISRFYTKKYCCLTVPIILRRGTLLCFRKFLVPKKLMDKRGEGRREYHDFPSKNVCLTVPEKFRRGNLQCVTNFGYRKILCFRDLSHNFVEIFFVSVLKNFVGEPLWSVYQKKSGIEKKIMDKKGGREEGVSRFSVEKFWSHSAKTFRGHPFNVSENLGYRKILCITGGITFFRRIMMVSQCRKNSRASLENFRKIGVSKNFMHNSITIFRRKYFVSRCRKIS